MKRAAVYCGTRNLYQNMVTAAKSLLIHSNVDKIYFLIEDDNFPYELPPKTTTINIREQKYFLPDGPNFNSSWTYMVLIRAALSKIFPKLDTILSLDVDTIVNEDISDIWDIPLKNYYLAGVREPEKSTEDSLYINMGVALFNLKKLRKDKKDNEIIHALNTIQYDYNEQDCINEKCKGAIYELSPDYNVTNYTVKAKHRKIIHYAAIKGWEKLPLVKSYEKRVPIYQSDLSALDIIIPTYNDKKGLIRTLKSIPVRNDVHITVVDDCSPVPYIEEVRKLFPHVTYFQKGINEGPGMARAFGISVSSNPYIMFIDSDDYLLPGAIDLVINKIKENTMPDLYVWRWLNEENNQFSSEWNPLMHGNVYKREFLELYNIRFCEESSYSNEDIGFNHICGSIIKHIGTYDNTVHKLFCETPIYMYTYNKNSITHANSKEFKYTKQTRGLMLNGIHIYRSLINNKVDKEVLLYEISNIMVGLYEDFLRCLGRPDLLQENWDNIRKFYVEVYSRYEKENAEELQMMFAQRVRTFIRLNKGRPNIKRFLTELRLNEIVPECYGGVKNENV